MPTRYLNVAEVEGGGTTTTTSALTLNDDEYDEGRDAGRCDASAISNSNNDDGGLDGIFILPLFGNYSQRLWGWMGTIIPIPPRLTTLTPHSPLLTPNS